MQKTNLLVAFASYAALLSAAILCAAMVIEAQRRSNEMLSHRTHRLVKTMHHCFSTLMSSARSRTRCAAVVGGGVVNGTDSAGGELNLGLLQA